MNYTFYILFTLSFFSCKQNHGIKSQPEKQEIVDQSDTLDGTSDHQNQLKEDDESISNQDPAENDVPATPDNNSEDRDQGSNTSEGESQNKNNPEKDSKPELPPVYKDPKPIPGKTDNTVPDGDSKPELPPVYKEPKPIPGKTDNSTKDNTDQGAGIHDLFDLVLKKYVSANGKVNYNGLKANRKDLDKYTNFLSQNPPQPAWSKNKKLAYWINAYNAFTLTRIIDNYPIKSIMDLDNGKTWDVQWIKIGNKTYSLNNIENEIIRPKFNEPRIHFAVNCAAKSCPPLHNMAYTAENLEQLLDKNTKSFINNSGFNTITASTVEVSKIFEWYKDDFGNLIEFLNKYSVNKINKEATVNFKPYNWSLNN